MDADHFDALSRRLGTLDTRRGVLRLLGALPLVGALAALAGGEAKALLDKDHRGRGKGSGKPCDPSCATCCGGRCVDTDTDPQNCGWCGNKCIGQPTCVGGTCQGNCPPHLETCPDGSCCNPDACQECQGPTCVNLCQSGQRCDQSGALGVCVCDAKSCPTGCCQGGEFGQCLVNVTGPCGRGGATCALCPNGQTCCGGECCGGTTGKTCCGNACVDLSSDTANCGACGNACGLDPAGHPRQCCGGECCEPVNDIICCRYPEGHVCCPRGEFCCESFSPNSCCAGPPRQGRDTASS
jgi:hypothetical protein